MSSTVNPTGRMNSILFSIRKARFFTGSIAVFVAMLLNNRDARASVTTLYWKIPGIANSSGNWDTPSANWSAATNGSGTAAFATSDVAFFSSTAYTTTPTTANLDAALTVAGIVFNSGAVTVTGSGAGVGGGLTLTGGINDQQHGRSDHTGRDAGNRADQY